MLENRYTIQVRIDKRWECVMKVTSNRKSALRRFRGSRSFIRAKENGWPMRAVKIGVGRMRVRVAR